jgi:eukaryotic-like serine/threonine-protein kinase
MQGSRFDYSPGQWARLRRLLDEALALGAQEQQAWLASLDDATRELKPTLARLLAAAGRPWIAALDTLPKVETDHFAAAPGRSAQELPAHGRSVGPYRLLRELGQGGMATVWLAERTDMLQARQVALKLPHGAWRMTGLAERMAREREILASLEHPHIARLYDAGVSAEGQPYLALEWVDGVPIDRFVREGGLSVAACLALVVQVCEAVAHAHAHLVVHRDLKPGNILVTAAGQVRLLDFGIAKLLVNEAGGALQATQDGARALTPDYAAPEQLLGRPVGTAADVYALGVVLFELLTGQRPHHLALGSGQSLADALAQLAPVQASDVATDPQRQRALRGDLDTIIAKAMKPLPAERYATVQALSDDLQRHLQHQPVLARPDSLRYRMQMFARRNRLAVGAGGLAASAIVLGAGLALWQAREAGVQRDAALQAQRQAEQQTVVARRAEQAAEAQADLVSFVLADLSNDRSQADMQQQLDRAVNSVRAQYRNNGFLRARLLMDIGERLRSFSDFERANQLFAEAEPLLRANGDAAPLARLLCIRARDVAFDGRFDHAAGLIAEAAAELSRVQGDADRARAACLVEEAAVARQRGDLRRAVAATEQARQLEVQAGVADSEDHAETLQALARAYHQSGRYREAADTARAGMALRSRLGRDHTPGMMNTQAQLASSLREGGRPLDALRLHEALEAGTAGREIAVGPRRFQHAAALVSAGRHARAAPLLVQLLADARQRNDRTEVRAVTILQIQSMVDSGAHGEAQAKLLEAEQLYAALLAGKRYVARLLLFARAQVGLAVGDLPLAEAALLAARELIERTAQADDPAWRLAHRLQARLHLVRGEAQAALDSAEPALRMSRQQAADPQASLCIAEDLLLRAQVHRLRGDLPQAQADARLAAQHARDAAGAEHPVTRQALALAA